LLLLRLGLYLSWLHTAAASASAGWREGAKVKGAGSSAGRAVRRGVHGTVAFVGQNITQIKATTKANCRVVCHAASKHWSAVRTHAIGGCWAQHIWCMIPCA
jgi:hypothetical protein